MSVLYMNMVLFMSKRTDVIKSNINKIILFLVHLFLSLLLVFFSSTIKNKRVKPYFDYRTMYYCNIEIK